MTCAFGCSGNSTVVDGLFVVENHGILICLSVPLVSNFDVDRTRGGRVLYLQVGSSQLRDRHPRIDARRRPRRDMVRSVRACVYSALC
jgi:hypothetical protein